MAIHYDNRIYFCIFIVKIKKGGCIDLHEFVIKILLAQYVAKRYYYFNRFLIEVTKITKKVLDPLGSLHLGQGAASTENII
jgi:hypothetical protein